MPGAVSILSGLQKASNTEILHYDVIDVEGKPVEGGHSVQDVVAAAKDADTIIVCIGEHTYAEGVGDIDGKLFKRGYNHV